MELKQYLAVVWKWAWLIVLAVAVAAFSSYYASRSATKVYQASTTLMVGQGVNNPNPDSSQIYTSEQLAQTYVQMVKRQPVLQGVVDTLKLSIPWEALKGQVSAAPIQGTNMLEIRVVDTNPLRAKVLADEAAHQLILQSPTPTDQQQDQRVAFVNNQLSELEKRIEQANQSIEDLQTSLANEVSARRIQDIQTQIATLQNQLNIWQTNYAVLLTYAKGGVNYLSVLESASLPTWPINASNRQNMLLAASIGLILAVAAAFLMEYLDDTIKSPDDVQRVLNSAPLAMIARIGNIKEPGDALVAANAPKSSLAEAYRVLRTNLQFAAVDNPVSILVITSSGPQEGKSTTAANLAVVMAQAGKRTLLVDTDLRRPSQHKVFALSNRLGLTNLLLADQPDLVATAQKTSVEGLSVLTSGPLPPNPAELLASKRLDAVIDLARANYDSVIFDSPPVLAVADASILTAKVGEVFMVVDTGRTRSDVARRAKEALDKTGASFLGVALNRLSPRRSGYGYNYYYYDSSDGDQRKGRRRRKGIRGWLRKVTRPLRPRFETPEGTAAAPAAEAAGGDGGQG